MVYNFYDTCSLLLMDLDQLIKPEEEVVICSLTLNELEKIKTASNKDIEVKVAARKLLHWLDEHIDSY